MKFRKLIVFSKFRYLVLLAFISLLVTITIIPELAKASLKKSDFFSNRSEFLVHITHKENLHQQKSKDLLEQGRILYEAGRFSEASTVWEQAVEDFKNQNDYLNQALGLSYLANAYQDLGKWEKANIAITESLKILHDLNIKNKSYARIMAQVLNTQGSLLLAIGETEKALNTWQLAEKAYREAGDETGILGSQINQAQALRTLGLYRRSENLLSGLNTQLQTMPDSLLKATGLRSLGIALQVVGDLNESLKVLQQSLAIAERINSPEQISATLFSLGNTARGLQQLDAAATLYQKAAETANNPLDKLEARLNQLSLLVDSQQLTAAQALLPIIQSEIAQLSPSRDGVYAQVNFAQSLIKMAQGREKAQTESLANYTEIGQLLANAVQQARSLKDPRSESYALGQLGNLYQQTQQWKEAQDLTRQALIIAQAISADDISARWQSQLGYILKQQGDIRHAIATYTEAVNTLQSLRSDLVAINPDVQFSFRESVEPVYRELVGLLLLQSHPSQLELKKAREVLEALQLAELDNFFREACLDVQPQQIEQIDPTIAVIYPIILPDRLEVILSLPGQPLRHYATSLPQTDVEKTISDLLESLNPFFDSGSRLRLSQTVYDWLIRPIEQELATHQIKTLVFIPDGSLRNLPMAALYDGKQYLVEKYSIALTPGLQLLPPQAIAPRQLKVLTAGLTESRQGFAALPGVKSEVQQIASEVSAKIFLDQAFTESNLQKQLASTAYPIVHLATHGQFSSNPEQTFILTWDGKIKVKEFEALLRSRQQNQLYSIELLVLSACQTAAGDNRAALGLAGVAVRSGARSTLATLWSVKDESTAQLMTKFYQQISQGVRKADALRTAQLELLKQPKYEHPFYWAPFILLGNWL